MWDARKWAHATEITPPRALNIQKGAVECRGLRTRSPTFAKGRAEGSRIVGEIPDLRGRNEEESGLLSFRLS